MKREIDSKQYNNIADNYVKNQEERLGKKYVYTPGILKVLGNIKQKDILDLACGDGYLTRELKMKGANQVIGCDISEQMVKKALAEEKREPKNIEYILTDVAKLKKIGNFDIITAAFLLHYSQNKKILNKMVKNIFNNLKVGGRFVTLNNNPEHPTNPVKKYETTITAEKLPLKEGEILKLEMYDQKGNPDCCFDFYYWNKKTYEGTLRKAGFKNVKWISLTASADGVKKYGKIFWREIQQHPTTIVIEAEK
ncbi:MAG: class I SAM-dependent methyltransferase [Candidatus Paceibacterota bacterium]